MTHTAPTTPAVDDTPPNASATRSIALQLKMACAGTIGFAILILLGVHPATDWPVRWFGDLLFWPLGDMTSELQDEARLLAAIIGGIMTGFGLLIWMLVDELIDDHPAVLRRLVMTTMAVWFILDSGGSIIAGAPLNVVGNIGFLLMFILPARRLA